MINIAYLSLIHSGASATAPIGLGKHLMILGFTYYMITVTLRVLYILNLLLLVVFT